MRIWQHILKQDSGVSNAPTSWTFTSSSNYANGGVPTQAKLSDNNSYTYWGNTAEPNAFLRADFGSAKTLSDVYYRAVPAEFDGWGAGFTNGRLIQHSLDGSTWTTLLTITNASETTTTRYTLPTPVSARYVRFFNEPNGYMAISEFHFG